MPPARSNLFHGRSPIRRVAKPAPKMREGPDVDGCIGDVLEPRGRGKDARAGGEDSDGARYAHLDLMPSSSATFRSATPAPAPWAAERAPITGPTGAAPEGAA